MSVADKFFEERKQQPLLINIECAAKMLGISSRHLHNLVKDGVVPSCQLGKRRLFSVEKLQEYVNSINSGN